MKSEKAARYFSSPLFLFSSLLLLCCAIASFLLLSAFSNLPNVLLLLFSAVIFLILFVSSKKGNPAFGFMKVSYTIMMFAVLVSVCLYDTFMILLFVIGLLMNGINGIWSFLAEDSENKLFGDVFPEMTEIILLVFFISLIYFVMVFLPIRKLKNNASSFVNGCENELKTIKNTGVMFIVFGVLIFFESMLSLYDTISRMSTAYVICFAVVCFISAACFFIPGICALLSKNK